MRLLHAKSIQLRSFEENVIPPYAILSHTWGENEVSFQDIYHPDAASKAAYKKIKYGCRDALRVGLEYVWVDTCCIDKTSSAELSEAINSMFRWYKNARYCYAYLADVPDGTKSRMGPKWTGRNHFLLAADGSQVDGRFKSFWRLQKLHSSRAEGDILGLEVT